MVLLFAFLFIAMIFAQVVLLFILKKNQFRILKIVFSDELKHFNGDSSWIVFSDIPIMAKIWFLAPFHFSIEFINEEFQQQHPLLVKNLKLLQNLFLGCFSSILLVSLIGIFLSN